MIVETVRTLLQNVLNPEVLDVIDESQKHAIYQPGRVTHLKIIVVSLEFEKKNLLSRHRLINSILKESLSELKATSLSLFTPQEWSSSSEKDLRSPNCHGG